MNRLLPFLLIIILGGVLLVFGSSLIGYSQTIPIAKIGEANINISAGWNLISVTSTMVGKSLGDVAHLKCGGANGGWITHGWLFVDGKWKLVRGTTDKHDAIVDIRTFTVDLLGYGVWVHLDPSHDKCTLSCGNYFCLRGTPVSSAPAKTVTGQVTAGSLTGLVLDNKKLLVDTVYSGNFVKVTTVEIDGGPVYSAIVSDNPHYFGFTERVYVIQIISSSATSNTNAGSAEIIFGHY